MLHLNARIVCTDTVLLIIRTIEEFRRPGFDYRHYQKEKVVGLERGPLSLVSTTEKLPDRKVAAPV
jgi:hypothetical protein